MLDPIIDFVTRIFQLFGHGVGLVIAWLLWPFLTVRRWYRNQKWLIRGPLLIVFLGLVVSYSYFIFNTQVWSGFDPDYVEKYKFEERKAAPGDKLVAKGGDKCAISAIVEVTADLVDFNVNENKWIPSSLLSKLGLFGMGWKYTPFMDNKAAFQLGINRAVRRTSIELVDKIARVRGTSQIDQSLQDARSDIHYDEDAWYVGKGGLQQPAPRKFRSALKNFRKFNERLGKCDATIDARADNLLEFIDTIASDIGSTSDLLRSRMEASDAGWFDTRADDRFWFAYGQLYAYDGIVQAMHSDFGVVFSERALQKTWQKTKSQLRSALNVQPFIISNGSESAFIMPSHLAAIGVYLHGVRANLVEIRDVLKR